MPVIHFTLSKYKSGKTFIAWLLAQYHLSNCQPLKIIDLDTNLGIYKFKALLPNQLNVMQTNSTSGTIEYNFETILNTIKSTYSDILFDTPSSMYDLIVNNFRKENNSLVNFLAQLDIKIVFHIPISGGELKEDNIACANEILNTIPGVNVVIWLNHYPKPIIDSSSLIISEQSKLTRLFVDSKYLKYIVSLPVLTSGESVTRDNDLMLIKKMLLDKRIFDEILEPKKFKFAEEPILGEIPVFIMTDYQISFLRDEFEKAIQNVAEVAS